MQNLYEILGLSKEATGEEIKSAYKKLAMKHHPDRNAGSKESEDKFKEIVSAYEVLSDPEKRANYDRFGTTDARSAGAGFNFNMDDIFSQFGDIFGGFGQSFGRRQRKGSDIRLKVSLTLNELIFGSDKKLKYKRMHTCGSCGGAGGTDLQVCSGCSGTGQKVFVQNTPFGRIQQTTTCNDCLGEGRRVKNLCGKCGGEGAVAGEEIVDVKLPPGALSGMQMNMPGYGNCVRDGQPGDLHILIEEIPDNHFRREETNLIYELPITISDAVLGIETEISTPRGPQKLSIDPGTESGSLITIKGRGIPNLSPNGNVFGNGDLIIKVKIKIPKNISQVEKEIFSKLRNL